MLDCEIVLTGKYPEKTAHPPAACEARVERERTIDKPDHGTNVLAEASQDEGRARENTRIVLRHLKRLPGKVDALVTMCLRRVGPSFIDEPHVRKRRLRKCRPEFLIDRDRPIEQFQRFKIALSCCWIIGRKRTQV